MPVDLEGKVDERAGIRRNCTGACLNASIPCRNGGQCIDGYASYVCDCNNTAFDGYYCHLGELTHICICMCSLTLTLTQIDMVQYRLQLFPNKHMQIESDIFSSLAGERLIITNAF